MTKLTTAMNASSRLTCSRYRLLSDAGLGLTLLLLTCAMPVHHAFAAGQEQDSSKEQSAETGKKESEGDKDESPEKSKDVLAVVGGDIITVTRETIRGGTLLIEDGKIIALGHRVEIPEGAKQIDATGKTITPGFVCLSASRVGMGGGTSSSSDRLDPFDSNVRLAVGIGITTACLKGGSARSGGRRRFPDPEATTVAEGFPRNERFPGLDPDEFQMALFQSPADVDYGEFVSTCPCCGLPILPTEPLATPAPKALTTSGSTVIKMSYGVLDGMLVAQDVFLDANGGALLGAANQRNWRGQIELAKKYIKEQAAHEKATAAGKKVKPPRKPVKDDVLRLVKGEIAMRIPGNSVSEMQDLVELAKELDYKVVIDGAAECWVMGRELAEAGASVVLTPRRRRAPQFGAEDRTGTWIESTRVMEEQGVPFAVNALSTSISLGGLAGRDLTSLPLEAAFAVRGGASERAALASITIVPATMMGLEDRIGSLEVGKDADLLILNGEPLDYRTYVETAVVNGNVVYKRDEARVLPVYE